MNNVQKQYLLGLITKGQRGDGRDLEDFRKTQIETGILYKAEGSARVRMGKTDVIAGIKMDVGEPFPDTPDDGVMIVNAEFSPAASPIFERGRPGENAIELARVVDRGIRESHAIDTKKLCIKEGEKVWMVFIDIHIMNHDGNLIDASALAAVAALHNTKMPELDKKTGRPVFEKRSKKLPLTCKPITVTIHKTGENLVVDPTYEEESLVETRFTVATKDDGNLCAIQKGGVQSLSQDEVYKAFDLSIKKGKELRKLIKG
jgi:exosome complex component RRP42